MSRVECSVIRRFGNAAVAIFRVNINDLAVFWKLYTGQAVDGE